MLNNIPSVKQGNSMYESDVSSQPITDTSGAEKICLLLKQLIDKESIHDAKGAAKLQEAYDIIEEFKTEEAGETGSPEGSDQDTNGTGENTSTPAKTLDTSTLLGPMDKLKNYLAQKSVDSGNRNA